MRYSFHGKVRATGQQVDGFVEANSSTEAIDRLADQGIIGVYTVRPEAKKPRNAVVLSGQDWVEEEEAPVPAALPAPVAHLHPVAAPQPRVAAKSTGAPIVPPESPAVLQQLVDQVQMLVAQVEKLLSRPAQVVYQSGPARGGGDGGGKKRSARIFGDDQNSTLRDIFQNNLDLRRSLEKLANNGSNSAPAAAAAKAAEAPAREAANGRDTGPREMPKAAREPSSNGRDHQLQAQPAA